MSDGFAETPTEFQQKQSWERKYYRPVWLDIKQTSDRGHPKNRKFGRKNAFETTHEEFQVSKKHSEVFKKTLKGSPLEEKQSRIVKN